MTRHRRRSVALGSGAVLLALIALSGIGGGSSGAVDERVVQVVSIRRAVAAGARVSASDLAVSTLPERFANSHQLSDPMTAVGRRSAVDLMPGAPLIDAELVSDRAPRQSRDVAVRLDDAAGLPGGDLAGTSADLYLVEPGRTPRIHLVIADVTVVASSSADGAMVATLRVDPASVAVEIRAESAGSLRLVARPR